MKKYICLLIVFSMAFMMLPYVASADSVEVSDQAELVAALQAAGERTIEIVDDIEISSLVSTLNPAGAKTIIAKGGNRTITRASTYTGTLFAIVTTQPLVIGDGINTITFDGNAVAGSGLLFNMEADNRNSNVTFNKVVVTNHKTTSNMFYSKGDTVVLNNCTFSNIESTNGPAIFRLITNSSFALNNITIEDVKGAVLTVASNAVLNFNSGTMKGNNGRLITIQGGGTFNMNGGTIDGSASTLGYTTTQIVGYSEGNNTFVNFNGGEVKNITTSVVHTDIRTGSEVNFKGTTFRNCGAATNGSIVYSTYNGGGGTVNASAGTFINCGQPFYLTANASQNMTMNITGELVFENCTAPAIRHNGTAVNLSGAAKIAAPNYIELENTTKLVAVTGALTAEGSVATIRYRNNAEVLGNQIVAAGAYSDYYSKLTPATNANNYFIDANGFAVASLSTEDELTVDLDDGVVTVSANYDVGEAVLIVASYSYADGKTKLIDVETFDINIEANDDVVETVKSGFITEPGGKVKVMLWDGLDDIKPLVEIDE